MVRIFSIQGFRLLDSSIDIVFIFEFGHGITILKMVIFDIKSIILILNQNYSALVSSDYSFINLCCN